MGYKISGTTTNKYRTILNTICQREINEICMQKNTSESKIKECLPNEIGQCVDAENEEAAVQQLRRKPGWYFVTVQTLQKRNIFVLELKER